MLIVHGTITVQSPIEIIGPTDGSYVRFGFRALSTSIESSEYDVFLKVPQSSFKNAQEVLKEGSQLQILWGAWEAKEGKNTLRLTWQGVDK